MASDITRTITIAVDTKEGVKAVDKLNKSFDENQKEVKETTDETKQYEKQLEDTKVVTGAFTQQLDKMT